MIAGNTLLKDISPSSDLTRELLLQLSEQFSLYHYGVTNMFLHQTQIRSNNINDSSESDCYFIVYASAHRFYYETNFGYKVDSSVIDEYTTVDELTNMIGEFVLQQKKYQMNNDLNIIKEDFK
jgi:hypothetical protein